MERRRKPAFNFYILTDLFPEPIGYSGVPVVNNVCKEAETHFDLPINRFCKFYYVHYAPASYKQNHTAKTVNYC